MYCHNCGQVVRDDSVACVHCGQQLRPAVMPSANAGATATNFHAAGQNPQPVTDKAQLPKYQKSKVGVGVLIGFLTLIGNIFTLFVNMWVGLGLSCFFLIAGIIGGVLKYPKGSVARKTYKKGFGITAGIFVTCNILTIAGLFIMMWIVFKMVAGN